MANTFVNPTVVATECLMQLENNCVMGNLVNRSYEAEFMKNHNGWKPGSSINVKVPVYARVKDGATIDVVDLREENITLTLSYRKHVAFKLTSEEMTYNIDKFSERIIQPAMVAIADYIDRTLLGLYKKFCNQVGTPGTTPQAYLPFALAGARLDDHAVPQSNRHCVIDPTTQAYLSDHLKGLFVQSTARTAVEKARVGELAGFDMHRSQNVQTHTCGTSAGLTTNLVDDTVAEGDTTINIDQNGSISTTVTAGDIFTIASVYAVNPVSGQQLSYLRQFVVETAATGDGSNLDISCCPGTDPWKIYSASATETYLPYQTVSALPADNAAVTIAGSASSTYPVNLAFHRDAMTLCMVPLEMPPSVTWKAQMSKNGYSVRVIRDYDVTNDVEYIRFDVLFAADRLNPFMACRIAG
jgi:hypothetical protein